MDIGNFVAVNAYVSSMFAPLNFLGYIYQGIIQGEQKITALQILVNVQQLYVSHLNSLLRTNLCRKT